jgi:hypothetical protein
MKPKALLQILETRFLPTLPKIAEKSMASGFDKSPVEAKDEDDEGEGEDAPAKETSSSRKKKAEDAPDALDEPAESEEDEEDLGEDAGTLASSAKGKRSQGGLYEAEQEDEEAEPEDEAGDEDLMDGAAADAAVGKPKVCVSVSLLL